MPIAQGLLLCTAWYYTILAGFFTLYCPAMYLMFLNNQIYRTVVDALFALWELYPVALFQCWFNTILHHYGDYVNPDETTILIMNHRTRVDWNYMWIALYHAAQHPLANLDDLPNVPEEVTGSVFQLAGKSKLKFVLKDEIKNIPGLGWIMQLNFFLYVKRNWQEDQLNLLQFADYYTRLQHQCRIVLFPEGTDLSEDNRRRSDRFADTNKLTKYKFVLHPRTTGWVWLCSRMRPAGLASVYDVTVAYDTPAQTEADLLRGDIPRNVHFHFKRYSIEQIPDDEVALRNWLSDRWREKEESLRNFHNKGMFLDLDSKEPTKKRAPRSMHTAKIGFAFWTFLDVIFTYGVINSVLFQFWIMYHCLLFIFVTCYFGGFHHIQYKLSKNHKIKKN